MTVNYTTLLQLPQPVDGTEAGTWGDVLNNAQAAYLDIAIAGGLAVSITSADVTLTATQGTSSATNIGSTTSQYAILNVSGAMTGARNLIVPSTSKWYIINNTCTGGFTLTVKGSATTGVGIVNGEKTLIAWNGSDFVKIANISGAGTFSSITNTGLTSGRVVYSTTGGLETDSANLLFDGTTLTANEITSAAATALTLKSAGTTAVTVDTSQNVLIGATALSLSTTAITPLFVQGQALLGVSNQTNNANKDFRILSGSYVNNAMTIIIASGQLNNNTISYGGNTVSGEPATTHSFFTSTAGTLGAGTERMRIDSSGKVGIGTTSPAVTLAVSATDAILVPAGTTAQRPTGAAGYIRYNSTLSQFEGYTSAWGSIGGGATGGGSDQIFWQNGQTVNTNYTITSGNNAGSFGPITVASGVTVTVPTGSTWSIV